MNIGFSTGSLAKGNFRHALNILSGSSANVVELSALREFELNVLLNALNDLELSQFQYVSFHAPSRLQTISEEALVNCLHQVKERGLNIILHPDIIKDITIWKSLGSSLTIENMDKRKPIGRSSKDLQEIFDRLPNASFCLDLAHAKQVDPTMGEAFLMIKQFRHRLVQIHLSDVNSNSTHEPLNLESIFAYHKVVRYIDRDVPVVLESPVSESRIQLEMNIASLIFEQSEFKDLVTLLNIDYHTSSGHFY